ncbi:hypothetical protein MFIFM68171_04975 [Madurella fahalii]|uniref:Uncharacterized protein n=1 Tax=Madurella fahalii TaxID=1157608 RepID=A0ABQ0GAH4_9PEZI
MTFGLQDPSAAFADFSLPDSLRALETTDNFPEWGQPAALRTTLHRHQKQALWFFLSRESTDNNDSYCGSASSYSNPSSSASMRLLTSAEQ